MGNMDDVMHRKDEQERAQAIGEDDVPQDVLDAIAVSELLERARVKYLGIEPRTGGVLVTLPDNAPDANYIIHQKLYPAMTDETRWNVLFARDVKQGRDTLFFTRW